MSQELTTVTPAPLALTMTDEEMGKVMAAYATNCQNGRITAFDLDRIKIASGTALWLCNDINGEITTPAIECVIVYDRTTRAYFPSKEPGNTPPVCASRDGVTGIGTPGGSCIAKFDDQGRIIEPGCPLAQFKSDPNGGAGQACTQHRQLFVLRGTSRLPEVVSIPPTSLPVVHKFMIRLIGQGVEYHHCIVRLSLDKVQNPQGKAYGRVVIKAVRMLSPEEIRRAEQMRAFAKNLAEEMIPGMPTE